MTARRDTLDGSLKAVKGTHYDSLCFSVPFSGIVERDPYDNTWTFKVKSPVGCWFEPTGIVAKTRLECAKKVRLLIENLLLLSV